MHFRKFVPPRAEIAGLLGGRTNQEICNHYGIGDSRTFARWVAFRHLPTDRLRPRKQAPPRDELVEYLQTHTHKEAQEHYGVKQSTFTRWLEELDIDNHFYHDSMKSLAYAAKQLRVSRMAVSLWFRRGIIPGAKKINSTRVVIPESSIHYLKHQIDIGVLGGRYT